MVAINPQMSRVNPMMSPPAQSPIDPNRDFMPVAGDPRERAIYSAQALRGMGNDMSRYEQMASAQMPGVQGSGGAAYGGNWAQALATALTRMEGKKGIKELESKQEGLMSDISKGEIASLRRQEDIQDREYQLRVNQSKDAKDRWEQTHSKPSYMGFYKNENTGEQKYVWDTPNGPVDEDRNPTSLEGFSQQPDPNSVLRAANTGKPPVMPTSQLKEIQKTKGTYDNLGVLRDTFEPEFATSSGLPLIDSISNKVAENAPILADDKMKEKAAWWSNYRSMYDLIAKHGIFGSALSKTEAAQWKAANIKESMTAEQIQEKLRDQQEILRRKGSDFRKSNMALYPSDRTMATLDSLLPSGEFGDVKETGLPKASAQEMGYTLSDFSPEELDQLSEEEIEYLFQQEQAAQEQPKSSLPKAQQKYGNYPLGR